MFDGFSERYLFAAAACWLVVVASLAAFLALRAWRRGGRLGRWASRFFLLIWSLAFAACGLESLFALCYDTTDSYSLALTSKRWYVRHVKVNNWEFRDDAHYTETVREGQKRLTFLGDSFTLGHGVANVEDRFSGKIRQAAEKTMPGRWQVYNLAKGGWDTRGQLDELADLRRRRFHTDILVLVYCLNDVETLHRENEIIMGMILLSEPSNWILREAYLPNFLYYRYCHFNRSDVAGYFGWLHDAYQGAVWVKQTAQLDALRKWCRDQNTQLLVVLFPFLHQLQGDYPFERAHETIGNYFAVHGVPCLDLLDLMRAHSHQKLVVNQFDAHPNERAHAIAADAIWRLLLEPCMTGGQPTADRPLTVDVRGGNE